MTDWEGKGIRSHNVTSFCNEILAVKHTLRVHGCVCVSIRERKWEKQTSYQKKKCWDMPLKLASLTKHELINRQQVRVCDQQPNVSLMTRKNRQCERRTFTTKQQTTKAASQTRQPELVSQCGFHWAVFNTKKAVKHVCSLNTAEVLPKPHCAEQ